jgi:hypothetical protein
VERTFKKSSKVQAEDGCKSRQLGQTQRRNYTTTAGRKIKDRSYQQQPKRRNYVDKQQTPVNPERKLHRKTSDFSKPRHETT